MVSSFIRSTLLCLAAQLVVGSPMDKRAAAAIKVELSSASSRVASVTDIKLSAVITNTGAETVKLLNYNTVLDFKLPTRSFEVTSSSGKAVPFNGIKLSVSLSDIDETAYTVLEAGQSITAVHDVSNLYDFSSAGVGSFTFEPLTDFIVLDSEVSASAKYVENGREFSRIEGAAVTSNAVTVEVTSDVAKRDLEGPSSHLSKRARLVCSNTSRSNQISTSYSEAKTLASAGVSYINSRGTSDALYRAYWGTNSASSVNSVLNGVVNENSSSRTLSCTDDYGACSGGVIAYTVIATTNIYYCSIFFNHLPVTSLCGGTTVAARNIRGGTTLHEITHAVSRTTDVTYGCAADQGLSNANKIRNADNYNCFTAQVYANTRC